MNILDAQVWAVASVYDVPFLVTEDLQSRAKIEDVQYVNPFAPDFDPAQIGL